MVVVMMRMPMSVVVVVVVVSLIMMLTSFGFALIPRAPIEADELRYEQPGADSRDQRIAHGLELVRPGIDLKP